MTDKHFYASSVYTWMTTSDTRDLRQLLQLMDKEGETYNLYLVPLPYTEDYDIKMYQPQVKGTEWLGTFAKKGKSK